MPRLVLRARARSRVSPSGENPRFGNRELLTASRIGATSGVLFRPYDRGMAAPLRVALAQIAPVLLDRDATLAKVVASVDKAAAQGAELVVFGEALVPGYPVWLSRTGGAEFDSRDQKSLHARYLEQSVAAGLGHLEELGGRARAHGIAIVLGVIERALDRGGKSLYCSRIFLDARGDVASVHRKLMPTYEERLSWSIGDGAGLVCHRVGEFTVGSLLCWENWMPLARASLYASGEDLHVALWPGGVHNTRELTPVLAREGRSFCISVSGLLRDADVPLDVPLRDSIVREPGELLCNGGSCIAAPDGSWVVAPIVDEEALVVVDLDPARVLEERQNFDPSGHYARPDVLRLTVDRRRQRAVDWIDDEAE